jgi:hypothetical protein
LKGAVLGLVLLIPLAALAVYLLRLVGVGEPGATYTRVVGFVAVFAGLPAVLTAGGVARVAARLAVARGRGRKWSVFGAVLHTAVTGAGLVILTLVPLGEVPAGRDRWLWILGLGAAAGAIGGLVIGLWVSQGSSQRTT